MDEFISGSPVFYYSSTNDTWVSTEIANVDGDRVTLKCKASKPLSMLSAKKNIRPASDPMLRALTSGSASGPLEHSEPTGMMLPSAIPSVEEYEAKMFLQAVDSEMVKIWDLHGLPHVALLLHVLEKPAHRIGMPPVISYLIRRV